MPIKPENASRYPKNWKDISFAIRERAGNRCECVGECGLHPDWRCEERNGTFAKWAKGKIVLTVAHLNHTPEDCRAENLKSNVPAVPSSLRQQVTYGERETNAAQPEGDGRTSMTRGHTETEWRLMHWHGRELWLALAQLSPGWSQTPWEKLPEQERFRLANTWGVIVSLMNHHEELAAAEDPIEQINAELSAQAT